MAAAQITERARRGSSSKRKKVAVGSIRLIERPDREA